MFHNACLRGHVDVVTLLLKESESKDIQINATNRNGDTAFHMACSKGQIEVATCLLNESQSRNIPVSIKNKSGNTAFHLACSEGQEGIVTLLLNAQAIVNERNMNYTHMTKPYNANEHIHVLISQIKDSQETGTAA